MKSLFAHRHVIENIRVQIHFKFLPVLICPNQLRYVSILAVGVVLKIILCSVDEETQSGEIVVVPPHLVEIVGKFSLQPYIAKVVKHPLSLSKVAFLSTNFYDFLDLLLL